MASLFFTLFVSAICIVIVVKKNATSLNKENVYLQKRIKKIEQLVEEKNKIIVQHELDSRSSVQNVFDKKKSEQDLFYSKVNYFTLLDNSTDSIWSVDKELKLLSFNNSYFNSCKLYYDTLPVVGSFVLENFNSEKQNIWLRYYERAFAGEFFSVEITQDSLEFLLTFDVSFNPIVLDDQVTGVAVFSRDITTTKSIEHQLQYKVKELNTFIYKATHDLRSPLVSVMGLVQLIKGVELGEELKKYVDMIDHSVRKMDNLLIDLVKIVNVTQGKLTFDPIDFESMLEDILSALSHRPEFFDIIFRRNIHIGHVCRSDSSLLYSIFQNVIDNAIKYKKIENKFESLIIITIDVNQEEVKIGITDNGIGISEEFEDKVFDMFFRGTTSSSGTGLGLYIVKTSVEKLEGTVTLNSIYGKGTSVNIVFPNRSS